MEIFNFSDLDALKFLITALRWEMKLFEHFMGLTWWKIHTLKKHLKCLQEILTFKIFSTLNLTSRSNSNAEFWNCCTIEDSIQIIYTIWNVARWKRNKVAKIFWIIALFWGWSVYAWIDLHDLCWESSRLIWQLQHSLLVRRYIHFASNNFYLSTRPTKSWRNHWNYRWNEGVLKILEAKNEWNTLTKH